MEGFVRKLATFTPTLTAADDTALFRRIKHLDLLFKVTRETFAEAAIIAVERNQILDLEVPDESMQEDRVFIPLLDQMQQHCGEEIPSPRFSETVPMIGTPASIVD